MADEEIVYTVRRPKRSWRGENKEQWGHWLKLKPKPKHKRGLTEVQVSDLREAVRRANEPQLELPGFTGPGNVTRRKLAKGPFEI